MHTKKFPLILATVLSLASLAVVGCREATEQGSPRTASSALKQTRLIIQEVTASGEENVGIVTDADSHSVCDAPLNELAPINNLFTPRMYFLDVPFQVPEHTFLKRIINVLFY